MTRGKRACAGVDRGKGVRAAAGGGWTRADGGQTGKSGGPPGTKNAPLFYKSGLSGVRKKRALLLYKTTRRACAKNAPLLYKNGPARAKKARPCVKQGRAAGLRPPSPSGGSAARRASAC